MTDATILREAPPRTTIGLDHVVMAGAIL